MNFQFCFGDIQQKTLLSGVGQQAMIEGFCAMMASFQSTRKIMLEDIITKSSGDNMQNLEKIIQDLLKDMAVVSKNLLAKLEVADSVQKKDALKDSLLTVLQYHLIDLTFNEDPTSLRKMIKLLFNEFNPFEQSMNNNAYNLFSEPMKLFYQQEYCQHTKLVGVILIFLSAYCSSAVAVEAFYEFLKIPEDEKMMEKRAQKFIKFSKNHPSEEIQSIYFAYLSMKVVLERYLEAADKAIAAADKAIASVRANKPKIDINSTENILISAKK